MHDLPRLYAAELVRADEDTDAVHRAVQFYLHSALAGNRLLSPHRPRGDAAQVPPGCVPRAHADEAAALAWFETEHTVLVAAQRVCGPTSWQLARALDVFHWRRGRIHDAVDVWRTALAEAVHADDPAACVLAHRSLGSTYAMVTDFDAAQFHLDKAVLLARQLGDGTEEAHAHNSLAWLFDQRLDHERALVHATSAVTLYRALGKPEWEADMLNCVGLCHIKLGRYELGGKRCRAALALSLEHDHFDGTVHTLKSLGYLAHLTGRHADAARHYTEAITMCRRLRHDYIEAGLQAQLGEAELARGRHHEAARAWRRALDLYRSQRRLAAARRVEQSLDDLELDTHARPSA